MNIKPTGKKKKKNMNITKTKSKSKEISKNKNNNPTTHPFPNQTIIKEISNTTTS